MFLLNTSDVLLTAQSQFQIPQHGTRRIRHDRAFAYLSGLTSHHPSPSALPRTAPPAALWTCQPVRSAYADSLFLNSIPFQFSSELIISHDSYFLSSAQCSQKYFLPHLKCITPHCMTMVQLFEGRKYSALQYM